MLVKVIYESIVQALQQLNANKLRSFLSLLGISIGIFCIIAVKSAVDSLQNNIEESFEKLGNDVLYIDKRPWNEPPHLTWWKYIKRPEPSFADYEALKDRVKNADFASFSVLVPSRTIKYHSSHVEGAYMAGVTYDYADLYNLSFEKGRYLTPFEYESGANRVIMGIEVAKRLFQTVEPIGKEVRIMGRKFQVVGVLEKEGESMFSPFRYDEAVIISYNALKKLVNVKSRATWGTLLTVKAAEGIPLDELKGEVTGVLRAHRKLKPKEEDNFAINELSIFKTLLQPVFRVLNIAGIIIGGFALVVGMISVANIMFVSVKERTNIIGIKKALGARKGVILLEFLIESVILCVIGGLVGLLIVFGALEAITQISDFKMVLSIDNMLIAVIVAVIVGIISGVIPALQAARMDPVDAIRS